MCDIEYNLPKDKFPQINRFSPYEGWMELYTTFTNRDLRRFTMALVMGADCMISCLSKGLNIFEMALSTPGCAEFVKHCLENGAKTNAVNRTVNKKAVNFAADSCDANILKVLLESSKDIDLDHMCGTLTPLSSLVKSINKNNVDDVFKCIQLLLKFGANPNIPDKDLKTPLHYIGENNALCDVKRSTFVRLFCAPENKCATIFTFWDKEFYEQLKQYRLKLPPLIDTSTLWEVVGIDKIMEENKNNFEMRALFALVQKTDQEKISIFSLVEKAIEFGLNQVCKILLDQIADKNAVYNNDITILETAIKFGNWNIVSTLIANEELRPPAGVQLLNQSMAIMDATPTYDFTDYKICFYLLLEWKYIDVNAPCKNHITPLRYAIDKHNNEAINALLQRGAYIGKYEHGFHIEHLSADLLEKHLDNCVTTKNFNPRHKDFELKINLRSFISPQTTKEIDSKTFIAKLKEMDSINFIAKSKEHRYLLNHTVIKSFLFFKWLRYAFVFYINFLIFFLFAVAMIIYTMQQFQLPDYRNFGNFWMVTVFIGNHIIYVNIWFIISLMGILYVIFREFIEFIFSPISYLCSISNFFEVLLIVISIMNLFNLVNDLEKKRFIAILTIMLVTLELCLLVGSLPILSLSTHLLMLQAVCTSFIKCFALYSIFVVTFGSCFYILFGTSISGGKNDEENKFSTPILSVFKTIVMLTGEFDSSSISFGNSVSYLFFLFFVLFMAIVLFNLLSGLAISDTQTIKAQAELNDAICRVYLLVRYEKLLSRPSAYILNFKIPRTLYARFIKRYDTTHEILIRVQPNNERLKHIVVPMPKGKGTDSKMPEYKPLLNLLPQFMQSRFADAFVESSLAVFAKRDTLNFEEQRKENRLMQLKRMEHKIETHFKYNQDTRKEIEKLTKCLQEKLNF